MEILVPEYIFVLSSIFISITFFVFVNRSFRVRIYRFLKYRRIKTANTRTVLVIFFILTMNMFILYFYLGFLISYKKGFLIYRSPNVPTYEKLLQILEVLFECFEKTIMFLTLTLFLPILKTVSKSFLTYFTTENELHVVLVYTSLRAFSYLLVYFSFITVSMLGLYVIELMGLAECISMCYIYVCAMKITTDAINNRTSIYDREGKLLTTQFIRFNKTSRIYIIQIIIELVYKTVVLVISLLEKSSINEVLISIIFFLKIICFGLLFHAVNNLMKEKEHTFPINIFWTPVYDEDMMFFSVDELANRRGMEYEEDRIGCIRIDSGPIPNGKRVKHVSRFK